MHSISKDIIFYITIVEDNKTDHTFLRKVVHKVLPHAIVDSVYSDEEAIHYFNNCVTIPHLIFLDQDMLRISGRNTLELIRRVEGLDQVPVVYPGGVPGKPQPDFKAHGAGLLYSKPYGAQDLVNIVGTLNSKWLA